MTSLEYEWRESYAHVVLERGHARFFDRLFVARGITSLVIISPWIGPLGRDSVGYSIDDIAALIKRNQIPTYVITRSLEAAPTNRVAANALSSCASLNLYYNDDLHAKVYVCRCDPFGFALLSSANLSRSSGKAIELGVMIDGKGYGQMVVEELENLGKADLPGMAGTKVAKYSERFMHRI